MVTYRRLVEAVDERAPMRLDGHPPLTVESDHCLADGDPADAVLRGEVVLADPVAGPELAVEDLLTHRAAIWSPLLRRSTVPADLDRRARFDGVALVAMTGPPEVTGRLVYIYAVRRPFRDSERWTAHDVRTDTQFRTDPRLGTLDGTCRPERGIQFRTVPRTDVEFSTAFRRSPSAPAIQSRSSDAAIVAMATPRAPSTIMSSYRPLWQ